MYKELVPLARGFVDAIERVHVSLSRAASHRDALAASQAYIITPLLFHIREQRLLVWPYIQHPLVANMAGIGRGPKAAFVQRNQPSLVAIRHAGFDFEHESAAFVRLRLDKIQQHGHCWRVGIVDDGSAWSIKIAPAQERHGSDEYQHGRAELPLIVHHTGIHGL